MAVSDRADLSPEAEERITDVIRSLTEDHVDRGVELSRPMRCNSCDMEKSPLGSSQYGAYALCNDCLLEFTLALAKGDIENVAEYMTRRPDDGQEPRDPAPEGPRRLDTRPVVPHSLPKRGEKLMPRNEPC